MKRCPQCDFIYENDQRLCDMDGRELVHDSGTQPRQGNAAARPAGPPAKSRWASFAVPSVAGVALAAFLFLVSHNFTHRAAPQEANHPPAEVAAGPQTEEHPALAALATPVTSPPALSPVADVKATDNTAPVVKHTPLPLPSRAAKQEEKRSEGKKKRQEEKRPPPEGVKPKDESKLRSVLKKTGRLLKKPFKF